MERLTTEFTALGTTQNGTRVTSVGVGCKVTVTEELWYVTQKWESNCGDTLTQDSKLKLARIDQQCPGVVIPPVPVDPVVESDDPVVTKPKPPADNDPVPSNDSDAPLEIQIGPSGQVPIGAVAHEKIRIVSTDNPLIIDPDDYRAGIVIWVKPELYDLYKEAGIINPVTESHHAGDTTAAYIEPSSYELNAILEGGEVLKGNDKIDRYNTDPPTGSNEETGTPTQSSEIEPIRFIPGGLIPL